MVRKEVKRLKGYSLATPAVRVKLNQNESPYDLPPLLKEKVIARLRNLSWNRYPTPFCDPLRKKFAEIAGWDERGVIVANGSNVLIQALMIAAAVGGRILTVTPGFSLYAIEGEVLGNKVFEVPLSRDDFSLPTDLFLKEIRKRWPQVILFANPNAPTGNLFSEEDLLAILKAAKRQGSLVVIDEAYYPFSRFTLFPHLKKFPNLILLRTLSKAFSLAGVRLGFLLAAPKLAREILKVMLPFTVGLFSQTVGEVVLDEPAYVESLVDEIIRERETLYNRLKEIPGIKVYPSRANYILFQTPRAKQVWQGLLDQGILIRNVTSQKLPNALRVTVGTPEENRLFLEALAKIPLTPPQKYKYTTLTVI